MQLSIIIPTKDRGDVFDQTLHSATESIRHLNAEIVVVNDSKTNQPLVPENEKVKLIHNPKSGVASARNIGARESTGKLLLFLDDDILITKESVDHVLNLHNQMKNTCFNLNWEYPRAVQKSIIFTQFGRFMNRYHMTSFKGWYSDASWKDNELFQPKSVASFHLSIFREDFEKTKGYNEQFPHAGFEDYDFPLQLKEAGITFYIDSRITVFHNEADRMKLANWLESQEKRGKTRNVAVQLGYKELTLEYGIVKRHLLTLILLFSKLFLSSLKIIPNYKVFDPLYFKLAAVLQASRIFKGYTSQKNCMKLSLRIRALNFFRRIFKVPVLESLLAAKTKNKLSTSLTGKFVPNSYQYALGSYRQVQRNGLTLQVDVSDYIGHYLYFGFLDEGIANLFSLCEEGYNVIDIGTNIGWIGLNFARISKKGQVIGFEPDPFNYKICKDNIDRNTLTNLIVLPYGLGETSTRVNMEIRTPHNRGENRIAPSDSTGSTFVNIKKLDDINEVSSLSIIHLMKLDVEGYELKVLRGGEQTLKKHHPILFIELDDNNLKDQGDSALDLIRFLLALGYTSISRADTKEEVSICTNFGNTHFDIIVR